MADNLSRHGLSVAVRPCRPCDASRLLEIRDKSIRFLHEMRNAETGEVVSTCEITAVDLDREAHKSMPFPLATREIAEIAMKHLAAVEPVIA